jgi:hypothetical protein
MLKNKPNIGDIYEIKTPSGLAYIQYTHDHQAMGKLVRILPGLFRSRPLDFVALAKQKELYFVFYTLKHAIRKQLVEKVSHQPVPEWAVPFPLMKWPANYDRSGKTIAWKIFKASDDLTIEMHQHTPIIRTLSPEQKKLSRYALWPHPAMVIEIARGWTPECEEEFRIRDMLAAADRKNYIDKKDEFSEGVRHFLYFSKKKDAEEAIKQLSSLGFSNELRKSAGDDKWLVLAIGRVSTSELAMTELRDQLEALAEKLGGEYDGWELAVE